jgi:hypothetical protein
MIKKMTNILKGYLLEKDLEEFPNHKKVKADGEKGVHFILITKQDCMKENEEIIANFYYNKIMERQKQRMDYYDDVNVINNMQLIKPIVSVVLLKLVFMYEKELNYDNKKTIDNKVLITKILSDSNKKRIGQLMLEVFNSNQLGLELYRNMLSWVHAHYNIIKEYNPKLLNKDENIIDEYPEEMNLEKSKALFHLYSNDISEETVSCIFRGGIKQEVIENILGLRCIIQNNSDIAEILKKHLRAVIEKNCEDPFKFIKIPSSNIYHNVCSAFYRDELKIVKTKLKLQLFIDKNYIDKISDLTIDVFDCITALCIKQLRDKENYVIIDVDNILMLRGLKPNINGRGIYGGYKEKQRVEIKEQIELLRNTKVQAVIGSKHITKYDNENILDIQANNLGSLGQYSYKVRLGEIINKSLNERFYETQLVSSTILNYSIKTDGLEKRIGRYFSWLWRVNASKGSEILNKVKIQSIIEDVNYKPCISLAKKEDRILKAFDKLMADGVVIRIKEVELRSDELESSPGEYLQQTIVAEPPTEIKEQYIKYYKKLKKISKG